MSTTFFNRSYGQMPDAAAVARGLSSMTGIDQQAIVTKIVDSGIEGLHESNQLSANKLMGFLTNPAVMRFFESMANEQVQAVIRMSEILSRISPVTETYVRLVEVMFKEINLTGMDQVGPLSPASIQTYNEFKKAVKVMPFKKQAKILVITVIRQLAGYDRDMDGANEIEREIVGLIGQLYTELVKNALTAIVSSILPYGYKVLGKHRVVPFVAMADAVNDTFMAGQISPESALMMLGKHAETLNSPTVNVLVPPGALDFWNMNAAPGRNVEFISGYYDPDTRLIEYRVTGQEDIGGGQLISRGTLRVGERFVDLWEAPVPKVNSNDSGWNRMFARRTVMGQFFTFPQNSDGVLISGKDAEKVNNTVDVFTMEGNSGKNVVYHLVDAIKKTDTFAANGIDPHPTLVETIAGMNRNAKLLANWAEASSGRSHGVFNEGDHLSSKWYRSLPVFVRYNPESGQFEFARRLGETNELTDSKLLQIADQLIASAGENGKGDVKDNLDTIVEYLRDSVQTETDDEFFTALIRANRVSSTTGPWELNDMGSLNLPTDTTLPSSGLPPLFHNISGLQTLARERNRTASMWSAAGKRAYETLRALKKIADGIVAVSDQSRDDILQLVLELAYVTAFKTRYPDGVFLRATTSQPVGGGNGNAPLGAPGYQTVSSVLSTYLDGLGGNPPTYAGLMQALETLSYAAPEVELLRLIEDGEKRRLFMIVLLDIALDGTNNTERRNAAAKTVGDITRAFVSNSTERNRRKKEKTDETITNYLNGDKFYDNALSLYLDDVRPSINVPSTPNGVYGEPAELGGDDVQVVITAAQIATFDDLMEGARNGNLDTTAAAYTGLPEPLRLALVKVRDDAVRGEAIDEAAIRANFILAPLVSTPNLERYATARGQNALALPAYEGITETVIRQPLQGAVFKHNVPFAGKHMRAHFGLGASSSPLVGQGDAMDMDDEFDMLMEGRGAALGAPNGIPGQGETGTVESRLEALVSGTASMEAKIMASVLIGLPNTIATHHRLSRIGARLINVALLRPFETNVLSLISVTGLNGLATLVCPTTFTSEHHSQVSTMVMTLEKEMGTNVIDERRVSGICGFTSHGIVGGYNEFFLEKGDLRRNLSERPSVIAIAFPDTVEYALGNYLHLFNNLPIQHSGKLRIDSKCKHPAAFHLRRRFPDLPKLVTAAENAAMDINTSVHVAPILFRGLTRRFNPQSGQYDDLSSGVGQKAKPILNSAGITVDLANGGVRTKVTADSDFATARLGRY